LTDSSQAPIAEIDLCRAWLRLPRSLPLTTTDGRAVDVIHLGTWTHGFGPDFRDAIISIAGGAAEHGSIELHLRSRGWTEHRHHLDPRYNDVVLHVVGRDDASETRRADGKLVPTVVLDMQSSGLSSAEPDWSLVGGEVCADHLARTQPDLIRGLIARLGDARMTARAAGVESRLTESTPDAVLHSGIMDALGYAANREPMAALVDRLPWAVLATVAGRGGDPFGDLCAALLGAGGFLPMSDREIAHSGLAPDRARAFVGTWLAMKDDWAIHSLPATAWTLARIRPANHPIRRLVQAAAIIAGSRFHPGGEVLPQLRNGSDPTERLANLVTTVGAPALGFDRARAITTNVLIPFGFAVASQNADHNLAEGVARLWETLPAAESNERTRRAVRQVTGDVGLKGIGARVHQGLIHLDRTLCAPRRCYECPIAGAVVREPAAPAPPLG
jgi:hypothetical protein